MGKPLGGRIGARVGLRAALFMGTALTAVVSAPAALAQDECGPNVANAALVCTPGTYPRITYTGANGLSLTAGTGVNVNPIGIEVRGNGDLSVDATGATVRNSENSWSGIDVRSNTGTVSVIANNVVATSSAGNGVVAIGKTGASAVISGNVKGAANGVGVATEFGMASLTVNGAVTGFNGATTVSSTNGGVNVNINEGASVIGAHGGLAVFNGAAPATINNFGRIEATNNGWSALNVSQTLGAGSIFLNNGGEILATQTVLGTYAVSLGNVSDDTVNLFAGSRIVGLMRGWGGFDTINLYGGTNSKTLAQQITDNIDFEQINVGSGYWTMMGMTDAPSVFIGNGSTLHVDDLVSRQSEFTGLASMTIDGRLVYNTEDSAAIAVGITGGGSLTKAGAGTLSLYGANTYAGTTNVNQGSLVIANSIAGDLDIAAGAAAWIGTKGTTGSVGGDILADGTVIFDRSNDYTFSGRMGGFGSLVKQGGGVLTVDKLDIFSGNISSRAGRLRRRRCLRRARWFCLPIPACSWAPIRTSLDRCLASRDPCSTSLAGR